MKASIKKITSILIEYGITETEMLSHNFIPYITRLNFRSIVCILYVNPDFGNLFYFVVCV